MSDFVVGERIGEGSFGVVYSGAVVPRGGAAPAARKGKAKTRLELDERYKEKVILKKIKVGTAGAKECGDYEEWFNYRVARAAPESCAEFLGSFVADKTKSEFVKGGKWLVWKFEGDRTLGNYMSDRNFPFNLEGLMFGRAVRGLDDGSRAALVVKQVMRQLVTSLKRIHGTGIVHRDIKPSNLLIDSARRVKIADFGVGRILNQTMDPCNSSVGTIAYMSPERINTDLNDGAYDGYAGDIWSFGLSILEFYMGKFPFGENLGKQGDWAALMCAICYSDPPEPPAAVSPEFRSFVGYCLQKNPAKRPSAAQLMQHPFVAGPQPQPLAAPPPSS